MSLRAYQGEANDRLRDEARRHYFLILCAPTGSGKTRMSIDLMEGVRNKGNRAAFIVDRLALVDQASDELTEAGLFHGVLQADHSSNRSAPILVCSSQTLERWPDEKLKEFLTQFDLVVIDECHIVRSKITRILKEIVYANSEAESDSHSPG